MLWCTIPGPKDRRSFVFCFSPIFSTEKSTNDGEAPHAHCQNNPPRTPNTAPRLPPSPVSGQARSRSGQKASKRALGCRDATSRNNILKVAATRLRNRCSLPWCSPRRPNDMGFRALASTMLHSAPRMPACWRNLTSPVTQWMKKRLPHLRRAPATQSITKHTLPC